MAEAEEVALQASAPEDTEVAPETEILRSADYVHLSADSGVIIDLGHDIEISFLRIGPRPIAQARTETDEEERVQVKFARETLEVGRVRTSPIGAVQIAMNTLAKLVSGGHINVEILRSNIEEMIALAPEDDVDDDVR